jgi:hypothetical protein
MIRINLVAAERPAQKSKGGGGGGAGAGPAMPSSPGALQAYLFLGLLVGGALLVCGAAWWFKAATIKDLESQIEAARKRQTELQAIKAQVDEYEAQKRILDAKVNLIEKLQREQAGPVHMLDEVSKALPEFVWLTDMDQTAANVKFKGQANSLASVADFISNLQHAGAASCAEAPPPDKPQDRSSCFFSKVELVSSTEQNAVVNFEVSADFQNVFDKLKGGGAEPPKPAAPPAGAPGSAPKP